MNTRLENLARPPSILETERLLLRAPRLEDALELSALAAADASFARATVGEGDNSVESACTAIARMLEDRRSGLGAWWVVVEKASASTIGLAGYSDRVAESGLVSALSAEHLGHGFLSECLEAIAATSAPLVHSRPAATTSLAAAREPHASDARWYWRSKSARPNTRRCA